MPVNYNDSEDKVENKKDELDQKQRFCDVMGFRHEEIIQLFDVDSGEKCEYEYLLETTLEYPALISVVVCDKVARHGNDNGLRWEVPLWKSRMKRTFDLTEKKGSYAHAVNFVQKLRTDLEYMYSTWREYPIDAKDEWTREIKGPKEEQYKPPEKMVGILYPKTGYHNDTEPTYGEKEIVKAMIKRDLQYRQIRNIMDTLENKTY